MAQDQTKPRRRTRQESASAAAAAAMSLVSLPTEIIQQILACLDDPGSFRALCLTCSVFNNASKHRQVYKGLFENMFDVDHDKEYAYQETVRRRIANFRKKSYVPKGKEEIEQEGLFSDVQYSFVHVMQDLLFEMQHGGKNEECLKRIGALDYLSRDFGLAPLVPLRAMDRSIFCRNAFLLICSHLGRETAWERNIGDAEQLDLEQVVDYEGAIVVFSYEDLFSQCVTRKTDGAFIHALIPPAPFAGRHCYSSADWHIFACLVKLIIFITLIGEEADILEIGSIRPFVHLSNESSKAPTAKRTSWCGIYVYLAYEDFLFVADQQSNFDVTRLFSDGSQTCDIELQDDGSVTGGGRGAYGRTNGGLYTIKGTWTQVWGCPEGFKRVAFHKIYQNERFASNWLYDGIMVPGHEFPGKGLYVGRWKDDTAQGDEEVPVTGPFIFWQTG